MKRCLICEDTGSSLIAAEIAREYEDWDVKCSTNWLDIRSWIDIEPGAYTFDAFIFDLEVPTYGLQKINGMPYGASSDATPSLYYLNNYFTIKYPDLKERIIICSAYFDKYSEQNKSFLYEQYILISKYDDNYPNCLIDKMNELASIKKG